MSIVENITGLVNQYKDLAKDGTEKAGKALGVKIAEELEAYVKTTENTLDDTFAIEFLEGVCKGIQEALYEPVKDA